MSSISPYSVFLKIEKLLRFFHKMCGVDIFDEAFKITLHTCCVLIMVVLYYLLYIYTIVYYFNDHVKLAETSLVLCVSIPLLTKFYLIFTKGSVLRGLLQLIESNLYKRFEKGNDLQKTSLKLCAQQIYLLCRFLTVLYFASCFLFAVYPATMYLLEGKLEAIIPVLIPFVDHTTNRGYLITVCAQFTFMVLGACGSVFLDMTFIIFVFHTTSYADLFQTQLEMLGDYLKNTASELDFVRDEGFIRISLHSILQDHQCFILYLETIADMYFYTILVQMLCTCLSFTISIFLILFTKWYAIYACILALIFQLFMFCMFGTVVHVKTDEVCANIYKFPWDLLKLGDQKDFIIMLHKSQNARILTAGGMAPLNMNLFMRVMNTIYQLCMMILNFME